MKDKWPFVLLVVIVLAAGMLLWREQWMLADENQSLDIHFSSPAGAYDADLQLSLDTAHPEAEIYFTLDGQIPSPDAAALYSQPISLEADSPQAVVIRAQAFLPDGMSGPMNSATYFMGMESTLPMLSLIVDPEDFWDEEQGIYVNHVQRGKEWERPVDLTYISGDGDTGFQTGAGVRIHGGWTRYFSDKKSLRLYFRNEYGAPKLNFPIFGTDGQAAFDHLVLHNSLQDQLLFRNQLVDMLTDQMGGYATRNQPVMLFINGHPWGIYYLRERSDDRWLSENYGVPGADISDTPNNRGMQSDEQLAVDTVHWENLMDFVLENELSDSENYAYLQTQMDIDNFIDYYILQMYAANSDWPHHNVQQFRPRTQGGRWEWTVWDNDFAFDIVDRQMVDHVLNVQHPLGERMVILLNKLLENPEFRNLFITRTADLLNTVLDASNVQANIEQIAAELGSDISFENLSWDIDTEWDETVNHMLNFAEQRSGIMREHMVESLGLPGTALLSINQADGEPGWIVINDTDPHALPWQGVYFLDSKIQVQAVPPAGFTFAGWEGDRKLEEENANPVSIHIEGDMMLTPRFIEHEAGTVQAGDVEIVSVHINETGDIEGDWFDLKVNRSSDIDLRGWRLTDNDSIQAVDEGSLIFEDDPLLEDVNSGTIIQVIASKTLNNSERYPEDGWYDGVLVLYVGNGRLNGEVDPWFNLGPRDNLVLLAPGPTSDFGDDIPISIWSNNRAVTPASFGLPQN